MSFLLRILLFFLLFIVCYIVIRALYLYVIHIFLTRIFNSKVKFKSGHFFYSIQDILISNNDFEISCKLFKPSFGVHTSMQIKNLSMKNLNLSKLSEIYKIAKQIHEKTFPSRNFFRITLEINNIRCESDDFTLSMDNVKSLHANSLFSFDCDNFQYNDSKIELKINHYEHSIHFLSEFPSSIQIINPLIGINCGANLMSSEFIEFNAYSENTESIWRASSIFKNITLSFVNLPKSLYFETDYFIISIPSSLSISIIDHCAKLPSLDANNESKLFKVKMTNVELTKDKMSIDSVLGFTHVKFLQLLAYMKWFKYTTLVIKKLELLLNLEKGEQCDILILNYVEKENYIESDIKNFESYNKQNQNKQMTKSESENDFHGFGLALFKQDKHTENLGLNHHLFNLHNSDHDSDEIENNSDENEIKYFDSGFEASELETDENLSESINEPVNGKMKTCIEADEVKIELIAHRTSIASVYISKLNYQSYCNKNIIFYKNEMNCDASNEIEIDSLNIIYSNSDVFRLYLIEVFQGFGEKITTVNKRNISIISKLIRIDELILNTTLTAVDSDLSFILIGSNTFEECKKLLHNLFPKLIFDKSKTNTILNLEYELHFSSISYSNQFTYENCEFTGDLYLFFNGTILVPCGVVHVISEKAKLLYDKLESSTMWLISFDFNSLIAQIDDKELIFTAIKGEVSSFTFDYVVLNNAVMPKLNGSNFSDEINAIIFNFWNENLHLNLNYGSRTKKPTKSSMNNNIKNDLMNHERLNYENLNKNKKNTLKRGINSSINVFPGSHRNYDSSEQKTFPSSISQDLSFNLEAKPRNMKPNTNFNKIGFTRNTLRQSSHFDLEDMKHRPTQYNPFAPKPFSNTPKIQPIIRLPISTNQNETLIMSPQLTSDFVSDSLFDSHSEIFSSNHLLKLNNLNLNNYNHLHSILNENKNGHERVIQKLEGFKGEYFLNDGTSEFKIEKAVLGHHTFMNLTSKFIDHIPVTFEADQVEGPSTKFFYVFYSLKNKSFKAKNLTIDASVPLSSIYKANIDFNHAEIEQVMFGSVKIDNVTIDSIKQNQLRKLKSVFNITHDNINNNVTSHQGNETLIKCGKLSLKSDQLITSITDFTLAFSQEGARLDAKTIRNIIQSDINYLTIGEFLHPSRMNVYANKLIVKVKPISIDKITHKAVMTGFEFLYHNNDCVTLKIESSTVQLFDLVSKMGINSHKNSKSMKNSKKLLIFSIASDKDNSNETKHNSKTDNYDSKSDSKTENKVSTYDQEFNNESSKKKKMNKSKDNRFKFTSVFKNNTVITFNIDLNHVNIKGDSSSSKNFKYTFKPIFQKEVRGESPIVNSWTFKSISIFSYDVSLNFYDPSVPAFSKKNKTQLNIESQTVNDVTSTLPKILWEILNKQINLTINKLDAIYEQTYNSQSYNAALNVY
ncbi:hypothetical protein TRFO_26610 [Tritrichomonas foetus]|uniref:Uncharacterized protein n=1 Tax=Tritrichomonas foetus TaxID=1144522 RepID=A0A1J4K2C8_9EUKA|nr:hypothetical protein TRFO_26610 [Tritrichomonas foetus]|eukprot:OHT05601.1 hypothetical protein TRFO_26610 [Tritrichomonas foetus]